MNAATKNQYSALRQARKAVLDALDDHEDGEFELGHHSHELQRAVAQLQKAGLLG